MTAMSDGPRRPPLEWWGGVECTVNRVGDRWFDQLVWSGHADRDDDLERFAGLGLDAVRYPVLWERLAPSHPDGIDWRWSDRRLSRLRRAAIRPIVGLVHHGSGPPYTSLLDPGFPEKLAAFAGAVARRYPWVTDYTPVNEPLTTARFSALYGHWYPHARTDADFVRALTLQVRAVVLAMRAIRAVNPSARLIQTEDCATVFGAGATSAQAEFENQRRWLTWDLLCGAVDRHHHLWDYLASAGFTDEDAHFFRDHRCPPDIVGLNYYLTSDRYLDARLANYPAETHGSNGRIRYADVEAVRARPEGIVGHQAHLADAWARYGIPVALTEVHLACTREEQLRWLAEAAAGAEAARAQGVEVRAITAWALLGAYNWNSLVTRDADHYEPGVFDVRAPVPRETALGGLIRDLRLGKRPAHPIFDVPGWWRRPERLIHGPSSSSSSKSSTAPPAPSASPGSSPTRSGRPLLIVGATGTLGRAFLRLCQQRGLPAQGLTRADADIADVVAIDRCIRDLRPWAIVNAAGYVRVDDAERDPGACVRANVTGAAVLASSCRRHHLPFVTYSSDLVFDGRKGDRYDERDVPSPLSVYGTSKAEAEQDVLSQCEAALVIRTSAFFGPWDEHNFLAHLFVALDRGRTFSAATDATVSPTYVPDLVHASLDLLLDGERGLWHLANDGAVSWFDFATLAAGMSGRPLDRILPALGTEISGGATRPAFSALTSCRGQLLRRLDHALAAFIEQRVAALAPGSLERR